LPQSPPAAQAHGGVSGPAGRTAAEAELEEALGEARERGDHREYFRLVRAGDLVLPSTGDPADRQYATADFHDGTYVLAYTSPAAMAEALRDETLHHRRVHFQDLATEWPKSEWRLAINAGLTTAAFADPESIERLGRAEEEPVEEPQVRPEPEPIPEPAAEAGELPAPAVMQKVVPPEHVVHYLQHAYDQVAGYVHRARDVHHLDTPAKLVRALGLTYRGSPFTAGDQVIHVLRWSSVKSSLLRTPFGGLDDQTMRSHPDGWVIERPPFSGDGFAVTQEFRIPEFKVDSQKLPHGAELHRMDDNGALTLVATYDADKRRWRRSHA
jgi:hypothetical protein